MRTGNGPWFVYMHNSKARLNVSPNVNLQLPTVEINQNRKEESAMSKLCHTYQARLCLILIACQRINKSPQHLTARPWVRLSPSSPISMSGRPCSRAHMHTPALTACQRHKHSEDGGCKWPFRAEGWTTAKSEVEYQIMCSFHIHCPYNVCIFQIQKSPKIYFHCRRYNIFT